MHLTTDVIMDKITQFRTDIMFRNSIYLILSTVVLAGFGFVFWFVATKLVDTYNVGLATTIISAMNMLAIFGLLGFDSTFVRFLPNSTTKNAQLNTGFILTFAVSILLASFFVLTVGFFSPKLAFIRENFFTECLFIFFCGTTTLNILTDAVFLSFRKPIYTLGINFLLSLGKVLLLFPLASLGAMGIFAAAAISQFFGLLLSLTTLFFIFDYRPQIYIDLKELLLMKQYSAWMYILGIFGLLPAVVLPILITNHLGPNQAAFYFIAMMIANLMYAIPWSITRSLFAEGSHDIKLLNKKTIQAFQTLTLLLIPAVTILWFVSPFILNFFGTEYLQGLFLLRILGVSGITVAISSVYYSLFRVYKNYTAMLFIEIIHTVTVLGLSYLFLSWWGITGVGIAWFLGSLIASMLGYIAHNTYLHKTIPSSAQPPSLLQ